MNTLTIIDNDINSDVVEILYSFRLTCISTYKYILDYDRLLLVADIENFIGLSSCFTLLANSVDRMCRLV